MRRGRPPYPDLLTPREQEVLALIREGLTNEQIAARLGISESGARYHVSEILSKLGVESRREAAAWQGEEEPRRSFGWLALPVFSIKTLAGAAVLLVVISLLALFLGASLGGSQSPRSTVPERPGAAAEGLSALVGLAGEAQTEARAILPVAELYAIALPETSGLYTFRFHEPGGLRDIGIVGPYTADPAFPVWEVYQDVRSVGSQEPEPLNLEDLNHDLTSLMDAARADRAYAGQLAIVLWAESEGIRWQITPAVRSSRAPAFQCEGRQGADASVSLLCAVPTPAP